MFKYISTTSSQPHAYNISYSIIHSCIFIYAKKILALKNNFIIMHLAKETPIRVKAPLHVSRQRLLHLNCYPNFDRCAVIHFLLKPILRNHPGRASYEMTNLK